ncbi:MAG: hypothetical protein ABIG20_02815 [archaeon]
MVKKGIKITTLTVPLLVLGFLSFLLEYVWPEWPFFEAAFVLFLFLGFSYSKYPHKGRHHELIIGLPMAFSMIWLLIVGVAIMFAGWSIYHVFVRNLLLLLFLSSTICAYALYGCYKK